ncbi:MAG: peptidase MA family metallohydrolase, partial [Terriglobales bacterium]
MRLGQVEEPRAQLTLAYENDFRDVATVNTLRLLDTLQKFNTVHDGNIILKLDPKEAAVLTPYFEALIQRALANYEDKYHLTLPEPVQVEVYPNHADFAVRSVGLPGLGALGVTFGTVVAMDSPSARPPGEFNWATTLWHELDHVFVLTATSNLVPRWFAEGLAVHEETQADPEWGDRITPEVLLAVHDGKLLPIAELDRGFVHPTYAGQVNVSYYQAGRACDFIQDRWGADKLVEMVHDFAAPTTTVAVLQQALAMTPTAFDGAFHTWLLGQLGSEVNSFNAWRAALKAMVAAKDDAAQVIQYGEQARALYPDYIYEANPYGFLAHAYLARHDTAAAQRTLAAYEHEGGLDPDLLKQ